jgi:hypothetical protein
MLIENFAAGPIKTTDFSPARRVPASRRES